MDYLDGLLISHEDGSFSYKEIEMPKYGIDFKYMLPEWGYMELEAADADEAEEMAMAEARELDREAINFEIEGVNEIG